MTGSLTTDRGRSLGCLNLHCLVVVTSARRRAKWLKATSSMASTVQGPLDPQGSEELACVFVWDCMGVYAVLILSVSLRAKHVPIELPDFDLKSSQQLGPGHNYLHDFPAKQH